MKIIVNKTVLIQLLIIFVFSFSMVLPNIVQARSILSYSSNSGPVGGGTIVNFETTVDGPIKQIDGDYNYSALLTKDGDVYTWGSGGSGRLGNGTTDDVSTPTLIDTSGALAGKTVTKIAAGYRFMLALTDEGRVYSWGHNFSGQLGNGTNNQASSPVAVNTSGVLAGKTIVDIAAGGYSSVALASDGTVYTWGDNDLGQLGNGSSPSSNVPVAVYMGSNGLAGKTVTQVVAGFEHVMALTSDGNVYAWGSNYSGQIGDGSLLPTLYTPQAVDTGGVLAGKNIVRIAANDGDHSAAVSSDGLAYAWGANSYGELGNGSTSDSNTPVAVTNSGILAGKHVVDIAVGSGNTNALTSDGNVYSWGMGGNGRLGNGSVVSSDVPVAVDMTGVLSGKQVSQIAIGRGTSLVVSSDGYAYGWGMNDESQIGDGNASNSSLPVAVDISSVPPSAISAAPTVLFGGALASNVTMIDVDTFQATTPPGVAGSVDIEISFADEDPILIAGGFTYIDDTTTDTDPDEDEEQGGVAGQTKDPQRGLLADTGDNIGFIITTALVTVTAGIFVLKRRLFVQG